MEDVRACLNCGSPARLHFCANCGQGTRVHVPSAREFIHEFVTHYVALEGKLWRTLKLLLFKPGVLTLRYIEGRRASYVAPLRIFLTFSILFFATLKLSGYEVTNSGGEQVRAQMAQNAAAANKPAPPIAMSVNRNELRGLGELFGPAFGQRLERFTQLSTPEKTRLISQGFFSYAPYALLLLLPVFAVYLKLLYLGSGRSYGEHFLFSLHTNGFAYLQITLILLSPWTWLSIVLAAWLLLYLPLAMHKVYGGTRLMTFLRWMVLAFLHQLSLVTAVIAAFLIPVFI